MIINYITTLAEVIIFPGIFFLFSYALYVNWLSRKWAARLQNRIGPLHTGWNGILQPLADTIKLLSNEDITPTMANKLLFNTTPIAILALPLAALFLIPIQSLDSLWNYTPIASFEGDLFMVLFLLTITILSVFLAGWGSNNPFGAVGATRVGLMMLAYEIPLTLVAIGPGIVAGSLNIKSIVDWQAQSVLNFIKSPSITGIALGAVMLIGAAIYTVCLLAELELRPFDISEAETEIVHGWQVEFSGKKLALLSLGHDIKMVLASALLASLFLGGAAGPQPIPPIIWFFVKTTLCVMILSNLSVLFARFRIDQMLAGAWRYLVPLAVLQVMAMVSLSGVI